MRPGYVCAHHHLYSAFAPWLPSPYPAPTSFPEILERVWWRLDAAMSLEDVAWSARLAALVAIEHGCTAIFDHHESPVAIEGSLDVVAAACAEVGVRVSCAYGVTDRHGLDGAKAGLAENERYLRAGGTGLVGIHAAFTCSDETLETAAGLADDLGVGVHIHVAEDVVDLGAADRLRHLTNDRWLLVHGVHLADDHGLSGTIVTNPRSNEANGVGRARPERFSNPVTLGTDGWDADLDAEAGAAGADGASWRANGWALWPEARLDRVAENEHGLDVEVDGEVVLADGRPTRVDGDEIRAEAEARALALVRRW
jgi:cytosine/adenosine deaminase-related metal-dependent hydrolase